MTCRWTSADTAAHGFPSLHSRRNRSSSDRNHALGEEASSGCSISSVTVRRTMCSARSRDSHRRSPLSVNSCGGADFLYAIDCAPLVNAERDSWVPEYVGGAARPGDAPRVGRPARRTTKITEQSHTVVTGQVTAVIGRLGRRRTPVVGEKNLGHYAPGRANGAADPSRRTSRILRRARHIELTRKQEMIDTRKPS